MNTRLRDLKLPRLSDSKKRRVIQKNQPKPMCIYCNQCEGTTRDHVPPKNLFSKPRPKLVTVPCCEDCRQSQSLDDEYFMRMLAMRKDVGDNPSAEFARDAVRRSFTKPNKLGFTRALLCSISELPVHTPAGIYLGHVPSYGVNLQRLCKVIERTVRGLYFEECNARLPDDYRCVTYALDGFAAANPKVIASLRQVWNQALSGKKRAFGSETFTYWFRHVDGAESSTLWAFVVYGHVEFMSFTVPRDDSSRSNSATRAWS
jgi:hypothetical protein